MRWSTIIVLLLIAGVQPPQLAGQRPEWVLVACFALYNLLLDLVRRRHPGGSTIVWAAVLDLPAVAVVYALSTQPGGPLFALIVLAAAQTTAFMTLAGGLLYTGVVAMITVLIEPTLPLWTGAPLMTTAHCPGGLLPDPGQRGHRRADQATGTRAIGGAVDA